MADFLLRNIVEATYLFGFLGVLNGFLLASLRVLKFIIMK